MANDQVEFHGALAGPGGPRAFISYAHDSARHVESVSALAGFLASRGVDVHMDRWSLDRRRDWYQWAISEITQASFVLIIASPVCRRVGDGDIENTSHRGMQSELSLVRELLHADRAEWLPKLLPVVLPHCSTRDIPLFLQPQTADHYLVRELTPAGAGDLLDALFGGPPGPRSAAGAPPAATNHDRRRRLHWRRREPATGNAGFSRPIS